MVVLLYKGYYPQCRPCTPQLRGGWRRGNSLPSYSTEENRLIFSYWKSCCIFYKLSAINCLSLWSHCVYPVGCCSSCYLSHSIWVSFYVVHVYLSYIPIGHRLYKTCPRRILGSLLRICSQSPLPLASLQMLAMRLT